MPPPNSAKLYIDAENYAIRKFENTRDLTQSKTIIDQIHFDSLQSKLQHLHFSIEFKEIEGIFYPFFMEFTVHASIENVNKQDTIYDQLWTQQLLVTDIQVDDVNLPSAKEQTENTVWGNLDLTYNANFWDNFNIIQLTPKEEKLLSDLQGEVSLDKQFRTPVAEAAPAAKIVLSPDELRADFIKYRSVIEEVHTGLHNYISKDDWNVLMDSLYLSLNKPLHWNEFYAIVAYSIAQIRNGHTTAKPPAWWYEKKRAIFPFLVRYVEEKLVVEESLDIDWTVPQGSEILSINGQSTKVIRQRLWPLLSADGYIETFKYCELGRLYAPYLSLMLDYPTEFVITYKHQGQEKKTTRGQGLMTSLRSYQEFLKSEDINKHEDHSLEINLANGYAWLDIHSSVTLEDSLESYFSAIMDFNIQNLVIDLRSYWGLVTDCDPSLLYSYFVDKPFRFFEYLRVKSNNYEVFDEDFTYAPYATSLKEIKEGYFDNLKQTSDGFFMWEGEPCMGLNDPGPYPFRGKVYILVSGHTFSASADFVSKMSQLDNVSIIGEETGGLRDSFVSGFQPRLTLPNSKIKVIIPTWESKVCCSETNELSSRGVMPDHEVEQTIADFIDNRDTVKEYVLDLLE